MAIPTPTVAPAILNGYVPQGTSSKIWLPAVAVFGAATLAEFSAGTDYKNQIASVDGFNPEGATVDFPNEGSLEMPNIPGPYGLGDGTLTFNLGKSGTDARSVFKGGIAGVATTVGFWAFCDEGLTTGAKYRMFAVTVMSANPTMEMGAPKTLPVKFSIQAHSDYIAIPAA